MSKMSKEGPCLEPGCPVDKRFGHGLCAKHYFRKRRAEQKEIEGPKDRKIPENMFNGVVLDPEDFWQFVKKELGIK
jgi:hypothetical protein